MVDLSLQLSPHFVLREFVKSESATRLRLDNTPSPEVIKNLKALCSSVLEPVRVALGPVQVLSGYRCPALNKLIGGAPSSQHQFGQACDIEVKGVSNHALSGWLQKHVVYDQLIEEYMTHDDPMAGWVHCSYVSLPRPNRRQLIHIAK